MYKCTERVTALFLGMKAALGCVAVGCFKHIVGYNIQQIRHFVKLYGVYSVLIKEAKYFYA